MHSVGRIIRCGSALGVRCQYSGGEYKELFLSGRLLNKCRPSVAAGERFLCSNKSNDEDGSGVSKSDDKASKAGEKKSDSKSSDAKAKLANLLKSIVKESKEAAERKAEEGPEKKTQEGAVHMRLAIPIKEKEPGIPEDTKTPEDVDAEKELGKEMVQAVKKVVETIKGEEDTQVVESELVQKLKTQVGKKVNLSEIFAGMKIDRTTKPATTPSAVDVDLSRAHRVRRMLDDKAKGPMTRQRDERGSGWQDYQTPRHRRPPPSSRPSYIPIDLFGAPPLGIFNPVDPKDATTLTVGTGTPKLETWQTLADRDLKLSVTHPPANGFEEMILWTEQGKLWKFPIDNEQGLDEEAKVPFHEHIFLEPQLESWCPEKGPIRHFMELVCSGLSKNPFITVKEKHEQIEWYHKYFKERASIIKEVGAGDIK